MSVSGSDQGLLFSREYITSDDDAPSSKFSAQELFELSKLNLHLSRVINAGKLPQNKLNIAVDSMTKLQSRLKPIQALYVEATRGPELYRFTVDMFHSLRELYISRCPSSTIIGLFKLRFQLHRLEIINSGIFQLSTFLGPDRWDPSFSCHPLKLPGDVTPVSENLKWHQITNLRLSNCGIAKLDKAMHLFPRMEQLDLSYNDISYVIHLQDCTELTVLNISYNRISVLSNLNRVISNITRLNLSNNRVVSLDGLQFLEFLERFDNFILWRGLLI